MLFVSRAFSTLAEPRGAHPTTCDVFFPASRPTRSQAAILRAFSRESMKSINASAENPREVVKGFLSAQLPGAPSGTFRRSSARPRVRMISR